MRVLIIDNGSTDGTEAWLAATTGHEYFRFPSNEGVAWAWNRGIEWAMGRAELAVVLNNDVVVAKDCLARLVEWVTRGYDFITVAPWSGTGDTLEQAPRRQIEGGLDFCGFLITRRCWERVGRFDEAYWPAYFEDRDYVERMREAGVKAAGALDALVLHVGSRTIHEGGVSNEWFERNRARFEARWGHR